MSCQKRCAEALCSNAKQFGAKLDKEGHLSALDWHIEFGQLKGSLSAIRADYKTEDGNRMELRPVLAVVPEQVKVAEETLAFRHYDWFRALCERIQRDKGKIGRGKLKDLRTAIKQGEIECSYYLQDRQISQILDHTFEARYRSDSARWEKLRSMYTQSERAERSLFWQEQEEKEKRCLFFDAIEMIDHWKPWKEGAL